MTSSWERPKGFSVRLFLPGGDPDGVKIIEKSNWTGSGLVIPRTLFGETRIRPELQRAGVYLLVGPDEASQLIRVYVGEGVPIGPRLDQHAKTKDFWTHAVAFTSKDQNLNKAHVQFLESRLLELAKAAKRCTLDNGNVPQAPSLSEPDTAEVEGFLADVLLCVPVLGYGFFEAAPLPKPMTNEFILESKGVTARGYESATGFVVREGSQAVKTEVTSIHAYLSDLRRSLIEQGVFADSGAFYTVTQDYVFASPSTAAGVVLGRSANGRIEWRTKDGRTLKAIQDVEVGR
jgi:hypothetical protein